MILQQPLVYSGAEASNIDPCESIIQLYDDLKGDSSPLTWLCDLPITVLIYAYVPILNPK